MGFFSLLIRNLNLKRNYSPYIKGIVSKLFKFSKNISIGKKEDRIKLFRPEKVLIELEVLKANDHYYLIYRDDGRGIENDHLKSVKYGVCKTSNLIEKEYCLILYNVEKILSQLGSTLDINLLRVNHPSAGFTPLEFQFRIPSEFID